MSASDTQFTGSMAEIYDRLLVPLIFAPYAEDLAGRVAGANPRTVLETAAGTGVLTRAMASRLPRSARIIATDLSQAMLDVAAHHMAGDDRIAWHQADAMALPFADRGFDAVACQFGVMFFPDRGQAYREARRVTAEGGRFLFNAWDRISDNEFADVVTQALAKIFPGDPPRFMARTPHGYHDPAHIREELAAAGFASISIDTCEDVSRAQSSRDVAVAYCQGTPLRSEIEARGGDLQEVTQTVANELTRSFGSGPFQGRIMAHIAIAVG